MALRVVFKPMSPKLNLNSRHWRIYSQHCCGKIPEIDSRVVVREWEGPSAVKGSPCLAPGSVDAVGGLEGIAAGGAARSSSQRHGVTGAGAVV